MGVQSYLFKVSKVLVSKGIEFKVIIEGIYEYCGIQRCGKSTMMIKDLVTKIFPAGYKPENTWANFRIFIQGVHCLETMDLVQAVFEIKRKKLRDQVIIFDEVGQFMVARGFKDKDQTDFVNFGWQMPKRNCPMLYASNVGNSADVILRDATWVTVMPKYYPSPGKDFYKVPREEHYIESWVCFNYDCRVVKGIITPGVSRYQELFDSYEPID